MKVCPCYRTSGLVQCFIQSSLIDVSHEGLNRTTGLTSKGETTTVAVSRDETRPAVTIPQALLPSHTHRHRAMTLVAATARPFGSLSIVVATSDASQG